jgi:mannose-6-phosphate isomerase-like protein (cupin superfamily)
MKLILIFATAALLIPRCVIAQSRTEVFPGKDISSQLEVLTQKAKSFGSSGAKLGDYQSHNSGLSLRSGSGGAEVHAHYDDIFVVTEGKATLISGGNAIDGKTDSDGETRGTGILNGKSQVIATGDIVHIPAGTPHQFTSQWRCVWRDCHQGKRALTQQLL